MKRIAVTPRPDWKEKVEELGFGFHSQDAPYWDESACYVFTAAQVDVLEAATNELHRLCLETVARVIEKNLYSRLSIPAEYVPIIVNSWERDDLSLYGRFDLRYDGSGPPKLYEYNADTPTGLLEASVIQWHWLQAAEPEADQFNSIHERLIAAWQAAKLRGEVHFTCVRDHEEDFATTLYMEDTAMQAGLKTKRLFIDEVGWDGLRFLDLEGSRIRTLFKLYPWEWLIREQFGPHLLREPGQFVEPPWKMILSNKGILPILWEMFEGHPNLLPAYRSPEPLGGNFVKKPLFGREGANITLHTGGRVVTTDGHYGAEGFVYQALQLPPSFQGHFPVIGSWIIKGESAGMGIRESDTPVTRNTSRFVPHLFRP